MNDEPAAHGDHIHKQFNNFEKVELLPNAPTDLSNDHAEKTIIGVSEMVQRWHNSTSA
jgi:hypothetical protein